MKIWKVILITIASVIGFVGITIGGMAIAGSFNTQSVLPENISIEVVQGDSLFSVSDTYITEGTVIARATTTTEGVTDKSATLSLNGAITLAAYASENNLSLESINSVFNSSNSSDYITDGIIIVPRNINIDQQFNIYVMKSKTESGSNEYFNVGGISSLRAKSANPVISYSSSVKIAVDVPVDSVKVLTYDSSNQLQTGALIEGATYSLKTQFFPLASSKTALGADREVVYNIPVASQTYIKYYTDAQGITYSDRIKVIGVSTTDVQITAYTFQNTKQELAEYESEQVKLDTLFSSSSVSSNNTMQTEKLTIGSVTSSQSDSIMTLPINELYSLIAYDSSVANSINFGMLIKENSTDSATINDKIRYLYLIILDQDYAINTEIDLIGTYEKIYVDITAGEYKVNNTQNHNESFVAYKIIVNESTINKSGWKIVVNDNTIGSKFVVLFCEDTSTTENLQFVEFNNIYYSSVVDNAISWDSSKTDNIDLTIIDSATEGSVVKPSYDLSGDVNIPTNNTYKAVKYFAYTDTGLDLTDYIGCTYYGDEVRIGNYVISKKTYEITSARINALQACGESINVFAATVKCNYLGNPVLESGKYVFTGKKTVNRLVNISKTLKTLSEATLDRTDISLLQNYNDKACSIKLNLTADAERALFSTEFNSGKITLSYKVGETIYNASLKSANNADTLQYDYDSTSGSINLYIGSIGTKDEVKINTIYLNYSSNSALNRTFEINITISSGKIEGIKFTTESGSSEDSPIELNQSYSQTTGIVYQSTGFASLSDIIAVTLTPTNTVDTDYTISSSNSSVLNAIRNASGVYELVCYGTSNSAGEVVELTVTSNADSEKTDIIYIKVISDSTVNIIISQDETVISNDATININGIKNNSSSIKITGEVVMSTQYNYSSGKTTLPATKLTESTYSILGQTFDLSGTTLSLHSNSSITATLSADKTTATITLTGNVIIPNIAYAKINSDSTKAQVVYYMTSGASNANIVYNANIATNLQSYLSYTYAEDTITLEALKYFGKDAFTTISVVCGSMNLTIPVVIKKAVSEVVTGELNGIYYTESAIAVDYQLKNGDFSFELNADNVLAHVKIMYSGTNIATADMFGFSDDKITSICFPWTNTAKTYTVEVSYEAFDGVGAYNFSSTPYAITINPNVQIGVSSSSAMSYNGTNNIVLFNGLDSVLNLTRILGSTEFDIFNASDFVITLTYGATSVTINADIINTYSIDANVIYALGIRTLSEEVMLTCSIEYKNYKMTQSLTLAPSVGVGNEFITYDGVEYIKFVASVWNSENSKWVDNTLSFLSGYSYSLLRASNVDRLILTNTTENVILSIDKNNSQLISYNGTYSIVISKDVSLTDGTLKLQKIYPIMIMPVDVFDSSYGLINDTTDLKEFLNSYASIFAGGNDVSIFKNGTHFGKYEISGLTVTIANADGTSNVYATYNESSHNVALSYVGEDKTVIITISASDGFTTTMRIKITASQTITVNSPYISNSSTSLTYQEYLYFEADKDNIISFDINALFDVNYIPAYRANAYARFVVENGTNLVASADRFNSQYALSFSVKSVTVDDISAVNVANYATFNGSMLTIIKSNCNSYMVVVVNATTCSGATAEYSIYVSAKDKTFTTDLTEANITVYAGTAPNVCEKVTLAQGSESSTSLTYDENITQEEQYSFYLAENDYYKADYIAEGKIKLTRTENLCINATTLYFVVYSQYGEIARIAINVASAITSTETSTTPIIYGGDSITENPFATYTPTSGTLSHTIADIDVAKEYENYVTYDRDNKKVSFTPVNTKTEVKFTAYLKFTIAGTAYNELYPVEMTIDLQPEYSVKDTGKTISGTAGTPITYTTISDGLFNKENSGTANTYTLSLTALTNGAYVSIDNTNPTLTLLDVGITGEVVVLQAVWGLYDSEQIAIVEYKVNITINISCRLSITINYPTPTLADSNTYNQQYEAVYAGAFSSDNLFDIEGLCTLSTNKNRTSVTGTTTDYLLTYSIVVGSAYVSFASDNDRNNKFYFTGIGSNQTVEICVAVYAQTATMSNILLGNYYIRVSGKEVLSFVQTSAENIKTTTSPYTVSLFSVENNYVLKYDGYKLATSELSKLKIRLGTEADEYLVINAEKSLTVGSDSTWSVLSGYGTIIGQYTISLVWDYSINTNPTWNSGYSNINVNLDNTTSGYKAYNANPTGTNNSFYYNLTELFNIAIGAGIDTATNFAINLLAYNSENSYYTIGDAITNNSNNNSPYASITYDSQAKIYKLIVYGAPNDGILISVKVDFIFGGTTQKTEYIFFNLTNDISITANSNYYNFTHTVKQEDYDSNGNVTLDLTEFVVVSKPSNTDVLAGNLIYKQLIVNSDGTITEGEFCTNGQITIFGDLLDNKTVYVKVSDEFGYYKIITIYCKPINVAIINSTQTVYTGDTVDFAENANVLSVADATLESWIGTIDANNYYNYSLTIGSKVYITTNGVINKETDCFNSNGQVNNVNIVISGNKSGKAFSISIPVTFKCAYWYTITYTDNNNTQTNISSDLSANNVTTKIKDTIILKNNKTGSDIDWPTDTPFSVDTGSKKFGIEYDGYIFSQNYNMVQIEAYKSFTHNTTGTVGTLRHINSEGNISVSFANLGIVISDEAGTVKGTLENIYAYSEASTNNTTTMYRNESTVTVGFKVIAGATGVSADAAGLTITGAVDGVEIQIQVYYYVETDVSTLYTLDGSIRIMPYSNSTT